MKTSTFALAASTLLTSTAATSFTITAARSGSPIHLQPLSANGSGLWIGKSTSSYCPFTSTSCPSSSSCPAGTTTIFAGGDDTLSLSVVVPGGQQVYIAADGHVSYTQAHSANMPAGSIDTGFVKSDGQPFGHLGWTNGLVACPTSEAGWPYQIFAQVQGFDKTGCLGFDALTTDTQEVGAWQYT